MPQRRSNDLSIEELEDGLQIDEHALEIECRDHSPRYYQVSKMLALATSERDLLAKELKEAEGQFDVDYRREAFGRDEKVTDKSVEAERKSDKKISQLNSALLDADKQVKMLAALERSYEKRSYMLGHLVELWVKNYYSDSASNKKSTTNFSRDRIYDRARETMDRPPPEDDRLERRRNDRRR